MPPDLNELRRTIREQGALLEENNRLIRKVSHYQKATFIFSTIWYAILIGAPFAIYYYVLGPYFEALGFNADNFRELPGYGQFEAFFGFGEDQNNN